MSTEIERMQSEIAAFYAYKGKVLNSQPAAASQPAHFKSSAELSAAISDPRYRNDPAYRDEVASKLAGSEAAGLNLVPHQNSGPTS
jgi:hypothetical protein